MPSVLKFSSPKLVKKQKFSGLY